MPYSSDISNLRSEEVSDLLGIPPRWIVRWGISIMFFLIAIVISSSWIIHYPDLIKANLKISLTNSPKELLSLTRGKLSTIFVKDGQFINKGTPVSFIENTADYTQLISLSNQITKMQKSFNNERLLINIPLLDFTKYNNLGDLQTPYQNFWREYLQYQSFLTKGFYNNKRKILVRELDEMKLLNEVLNEQMKLQNQEITIAREEFLIQNRLAKDKVISPLELKREESKYIMKKLPLSQISIAQINNSTSQLVKTKEIMELDKQVVEGRDNFLHSLYILKSQINSWKSKYIIYAPISGQIFFYDNRIRNQIVNENQKLFYIIPRDGQFIGELQIPQQNFGKVKVGQKVIIKMDGYPYQEFGAIIGSIESISNIPSPDSTFLAKVRLPFDFKTTFGKKLIYKVGMTASAEIITSDSRLAEKFFSEIKRAIYN